MANNIKDTLQQLIDKNDPTQKLIGLLADLIENKLDEVHERVNQQDKIIERLSHTTCPNNMPAKFKELEDTIQPMIFINKYPKMAIMMLIGFLSLMGLGASKLLEIFNILK